MLEHNDESRRGTKYVDIVKSARGFLAAHERTYKEQRAYTAETNLQDDPAKH